VTYNPGVLETSSSDGRPGADRCPGVLRLAEAADGFIARVRLPGGLVSAEQLRVLARLAGELGDGRIELTSRGNVQLRGLAADTAGPLSDALWRAGLLPSPSHDRVRNVLASPLAGLDRGPDLAGIVRALDDALCARPRLAELSGRFLFAVDDGRGDVAGLGADVVATVRPDGAVVNGLSVRQADVPGNDVAADGAPDADFLVKAAQDTDAARAGSAGISHLPADLRDVVSVMIACAEAFLDLRGELGGTAWRVADLPDGTGRVRALVASRLRLAAAPKEAAATRVARPVGLVAREGTGSAGEVPASVRDDPDFSAVLIAPLGRLTAAQLSWVADRAAGREARITPWRSVVLPHLDDAAGVLREAAGLGFGTDEESPWLRLTACAGRPGCASALADVQADAAGFAARWPGRIVHVSGCARHCGRPAATEVDVTATSEGYEIAGV
jgi:precorrin-3B synthase